MKKTERALNAYQEYSDSGGTINPHKLGYHVKNVESHHACPDPKRCELESGIFYDGGRAFRNHWLRLKETDRMAVSEGKEENERKI